MSYIQKRKLEGTISASMSGTTISVSNTNIDRIEQGKTFIYTSGAELSAGQSWELWLRGPATASASCLIKWRATGSFTMDLYEDAVAPTGSYISVIPPNLNRNSSNVAASRIRFTSTPVTSAGTLIYPGRIDAPEALPLENLWDTHGLILKTGTTDYLLQFENIDTVLGYTKVEIILQEVI